MADFLPRSNSMRDCPDRAYRSSCSPDRFETPPGRCARVSRIALSVPSSNAAAHCTIGHRRSSQLVLHVQPAHDARLPAARFRSVLLLRPSSDYTNCEEEMAMQQLIGSMWHGLRRWLPIAAAICVVSMSNLAWAQQTEIVVDDK